MGSEMCIRDRYIGGGRMIHAATERVGVIEGPVQAGMIFVRPN